MQYTYDAFYNSNTVASTRFTTTKTTLTAGKNNEVSLIVVDAFTESRFLQLASGLAHHWKHPHAIDVQRAARMRGIPLPSPPSFISLTGEGIVALVEARVVCLGPRLLFDRFNIELGALASKGQLRKAQGYSVYYVGIDSKPAGMIGIPT